MIDRSKAAKQGWAHRQIRLQARREAVVELWQKGLSTASIAAILSLTFGTVKSDVEVVRKVNPDAVPRGGPLMRQIAAGKKTRLQKKTRRLTRRIAAIASGAITYIGQPCKFGHIGERRVSNRKCVDCDREQKRIEAASGYWNAYHTMWYKTHDPDRTRRRMWETTYRIRHAPRIKRREEAYRTRNALQLERKARERKAVRWNTINLLYGELK